MKVCGVFFLKAWSLGVTFRQLLGHVIFFFVIIWQFVLFLINVNSFSLFLKNIYILELIF